MIIFIRYPRFTHFESQAREGPRWPITLFSRQCSGHHSHHQHPCRLAVCLAGSPVTLVAHMHAPKVPHLMTCHPPSPPALGPPGCHWDRSYHRNSTGILAHATQKRGNRCLPKGICTHGSWGTAPLSTWTVWRRGDCRGPLCTRPERLSNHLARKPCPDS